MARFPEPNDGTQPVQTTRGAPAYGEPQVEKLHRRPVTARDERRRHERRKRSGLYLPAWSVLLMLVAVFVVTFGVVALVISLGGGEAPESAPRVIIVTPMPESQDAAAPTSTPDIPGGFIAPEPLAATQPASTGPLPTFALEGPTLPPVIFTPTPVEVGVGVLVITNTDELNVRSGPGTDFDVLFQVDEGATFRVIGGPTEGALLNATGTWWQVEDPSDPTRAGWIFAEYLRTAPTP